jgi:hypothetical protein
MVSLWFLWVSLGFSGFSLWVIETTEKPEKTGEKPQRNPRDREE